MFGFRSAIIPALLLVGILAAYQHFTAPDADRIQNEQSRVYLCTSARQSALENQTWDSIPEFCYENILKYEKTKGVTVLPDGRILTPKDRALNKYWDSYFEFQESTRQLENRLRQ